jgi:hypothetical protein
MSSTGGSPVYNDCLFAKQFTSSAQAHLDPVPAISQPSVGARSSKDTVNAVQITVTWDAVFVFGTYASPSSDSGYDSAWGFSSALFTPVPGISGIKIETLDIP